MLTSIGRGRGPAGPPPSVTDVLGLSNRPPRPSLPPPTPIGKLRIHLFAGQFASYEAAMHYCYYADDGRPEQLIRDLPDAVIDTDHVEVRFRETETRLGQFLLPPEVAKMMGKIGTANTLVIIAEPAFCGLAYALYDTPRIDYLGPLVVSA